MERRIQDRMINVICEYIHQEYQDNDAYYCGNEELEQKLKEYTTSHNIITFKQLKETINQDVLKNGLDSYYLDENLSNWYQVYKEQTNSQFPLDQFYKQDDKDQWMIEDSFDKESLIIKVLQGDQKLTLDVYNWFKADCPYFEQEYLAYDPYVQEIEKALKQKTVKR